MTPSLLKLRCGVADAPSPRVVDVSNRWVRSAAGSLAASRAAGAQLGAALAPPAVRVHSTRGIPAPPARPRKAAPPAMAVFAPSAAAGALGATAGRCVRVAVDVATTTSASSSRSKRPLWPTLRPLPVAAAAAAAADVRGLGASVAACAERPQRGVTRRSCTFAVASTTLRSGTGAVAPVSPQPSTLPAHSAVNVAAQRSRAVQFSCASNACRRNSAALVSWVLHCCTAPQMRDLYHHPRPRSRDPVP